MDYAQLLYDAMIAYEDSPTRANLDALRAQASAYQQAIGDLPPAVVAKIASLTPGTPVQAASFPWLPALLAGLALIVLSGAHSRLLYGRAR